jgi:hypothetical protein
MRNTKGFASAPRRAAKLAPARGCQASKGLLNFPSRPGGVRARVRVMFDFAIIFMLYSHYRGCEVDSEPGSMRSLLAPS